MIQTNCIHVAVTYLTRRGRKVREWGFLLTLAFEKTIAKTKKPLNL
jgi:hypothetical protein